VPYDKDSRFAKCSKELNSMGAPKYYCSTQRLSPTSCGKEGKYWETNNRYY